MSNVAHSQDWNVSPEIILSSTDVNKAQADITNTDNTMTNPHQRTNTDDNTQRPHPLHIYPSPSRRQPARLMGSATYLLLHEGLAAPTLADLVTSLVLAGRAGSAVLLRVASDAVSASLPLLLRRLVRDGYRWCGL